jgi:hypothetical protein
MSCSEFGHRGGKALLFLADGASMVASSSWKICLRNTPKLMQCFLKTILYVKAHRKRSRMLVGRCQVRGRLGGETAMQHIAPAFPFGESRKHPSQPIKQSSYKGRSRQRNNPCKHNIAGNIPANCGHFSCCPDTDDRAGDRMSG